MIAIVVALLLALAGVLPAGPARYCPRGYRLVWVLPDGTVLGGQLMMDGRQGAKPECRPEAPERERSGA